MSKFSVANFALLDSAEEIPYDAAPSLAAPQKRILGVKRILYRSDDLSALLPLEQLGDTGLAGQTYSLAFYQDHVRCRVSEGWHASLGKS